MARRQRLPGQTGDAIRDRWVELRALWKLLARVEKDPVRADLWEQSARQVDFILGDAKEGTMFETMLSAYTELVSDTTMLKDPEAVEAGSSRAAVDVQLERDGGGDFYIDVRLHQLAAAQIGYVLDVARRYELEAHEESGWLRLSRHLTGADLPEEEREPEVVEA